MATLKPMATVPVSFAAVAAVIRRPRLWPVGWSVLAGTARPGWWRSWPPVPLPPPSYLAFRSQTMWGSAGGRLDPAELVAYLEWCARMRTLGG